ncbi:unnamed protein product [Ectocarpus sp. 13 AM-2016]
MSNDYSVRSTSRACVSHACVVASAVVLTCCCGCCCSRFENRVALEARSGQFVQPT